MLNGLKGLLAYSWWLTLAGLLPLVWLLVATFAAVQGGEQDGPRPEDENPVADRTLLEAGEKDAVEVRNVLVARLRPSPPTFQLLANERQVNNVPEGLRGTLGGQEKLRVGGHLLRLFLEGAGGLWGEEKGRRIDRFVLDAGRYKDTAVDVGELIRVATALRTAVNEWVQSKNSFDEVVNEWSNEKYDVAERLADAEIVVVDKLKRRIGIVDVPEGPKRTAELDKRKKALENYSKSSKFQFRIQVWRRTWSEEFPEIETDEETLGNHRSSTFRRLTIGITTDESGLEQGQRLEQQLTAQRTKLQELTDRQQALLSDAEKLRDVTRAVVTKFPKVPTDVAPTQKLDDAAHEDVTRKLGQVGLRVDEIKKGNTAWDKKLEGRDFARQQWIQFRSANRDGVKLELTAIARLLKTCPEVDYPTAMIRERVKCHVMRWLRVELFKKKPLPRFSDLQEVKLRNSAGWRYGKFERFAQVAEVIEYKFFELLPGKQTVSEKPRVLKSFQFAASESVGQGRFPRRVLTADLIDRYNVALGKAVSQFDDLAAWKAFAIVCRDVDEVLVAYLKDVGEDKNRLPSAVEFGPDVRDSKALVEGWVALDGLFKNRK